MENQLHPELELSDYEKLEKFALTIKNLNLPETLESKRANLILKTAYKHLDLVSDLIKIHLNDL